LLYFESFSNYEFHFDGKRKAQRRLKKMNLRGKDLVGRWVNIKGQALCGWDLIKNHPFGATYLCYQ
jgi:hypothetical protein